MNYERPAWVEPVLNKVEVALFAALALAAIVCGALAAGSTTATIGLFAATLGIGWMLAATAVTHACGGHGLVLQPPALHADFHALSRFRVRVRLANSRRRMPALFLTARLDTMTNQHALSSPPRFLGRLDARQSVELAWDITARMRGEYEVRGVRVMLGFPGSLASHQCSFAFTKKVTALPAIYRLYAGALELLIGRRQAAGRLHASPASIEEFIGVREYRPGDNPRNIHWVHSLRSPEYPAQLVVREFEDPSDEDVCVVLDTAIAANEKEDPILRYRHEKSLSFTAALCRMLTERKYRVRIRALDRSGASIESLLARPARDLPLLEARLARLLPVTDRKPILDMLEQEGRRSNSAVLFVSLRESSMQEQRRNQAALIVTPDWQSSLVREVVGI